MAKFSSGEHEFTLKLTVGTVIDIKEETGANLDDIVNDPDKLTNLLLANPQKLVEMLYVVCADQCEKKDIEPRQFGRMFDRPTLDAAGNALLEAIVDFYPRSSAGVVIREHLPKLLENMDKKIAEGTRKRLNGLLLKSASD